MRSVLALPAALLVVGCAVQPAPVAYVPSPTPVVVAPPFAPVSPPPFRADAACVGALSRSAGVPPGAVRVTQARPAPGGSAVAMIVAGRRGAWACRTDRAGNVLSLAATRG